MHCLFCDDVIFLDVSWRNIFLFSPPSKLCHSCEQALYQLEGERCERCSREYGQGVCPDCEHWDTFYAGGDPLTYNYSIYSYNTKMQEMLARWKYRGDYQLGEAFRILFKSSFDTHFPADAVLVPIPLSVERTQERAFNQAQVLASFLTVEIDSILTRTHTEKQSKKSRKARLNTMNPFEITKRVQKPVILVDDLYTTGITLRHAAKLLKENGCPDVYGYTLIRA